MAEWHNTQVILLGMWLARDGSQHYSIISAIKYIVPAACVERNVGMFTGSSSSAWTSVLWNVQFIFHKKKCWSDCGKLISPYIEGEPTLVEQDCSEQIDTECPHVLLNILQPPLKGQVKLVSYLLVTVVFLHCKIINSSPCFHRHRQVFCVTVYLGFKNM